MFDRQIQLLGEPSLMRRALVHWHDWIADFFLQRRLLIIGSLVVVSWAFFLALLWLASLLA